MLIKQMIKVISTVIVCYCEKSGRKVSDCKTVSDIEERRVILSKKKLCFNCAGTKHQTYQ